MSVYFAKREKLIKIGCRLPRALLDRIDVIAANLSVEGIEITRSDVLRISAFKGVDILEAERKTNR